MATRKTKSGVKTLPSPDTAQDLGQTAVHTFLTCDRLNQMLIEHLAPSVWSAKPPGKVRSIAAIFTHMHNVRCKWIRLTAPHLMTPKQINRANSSPTQVREALAESAARCAEMISEALESNGGRAKKFRRDAWARPWPAGLEMVCYMLSHEAHHRGQICMLAHQLGFPMPGKITSEFWNWEKLWKQSGTPMSPGPRARH